MHRLTVNQNVFLAKVHLQVLPGRSFKPANRIFEVCQTLEFFAKRRAVTLQHPQGNVYLVAILNTTTQRRAVQLTVDVHLANVGSVFLKKLA